MKWTREGWGGGEGRGIEGEHVKWTRGGWGGGEGRVTVHVQERLGRRGGKGQRNGNM